MNTRIETVLVGLTVQSFRFVVGGTLILYLGHGRTKPADEKAPVRVWIESAWRLCASGKIIAGSLDDPDWLLTELQRLGGMVVESVRLEGVHGDIAMSFQSGVFIETFSRSLHDEQWQVRLSTGSRLGLKENLELYEAMEEPDRNGALG
jgi:hypothetical protein